MSTSLLQAQVPDNYEEAPSGIFNVRLTPHDRSQVSQWIRSQKIKNPAFSVIDVGGSAALWSASFVDAVADANLPAAEIMNETGNVIAKFQINFNMPEEWAALDRYVAEHGKFSFAICSHTLEDIANPKFLTSKLSQIAKMGFIAIPSKFTECARIESAQWRGYIHHRWIFSLLNGIFVGYPKLVFLERDARFDEVGKNYSPDNADFSFWWKNNIDVSLTNADYLGPSAQAVLGYYNALLHDDLDNPIAA